MYFETVVAVGEWLSTQKELKRYFWVLIWRIKLLKLALTSCLPWPCCLLRDQMITSLDYYRKTLERDPSSKLHCFHARLCRHPFPKHFLCETPKPTFTHTLCTVETNLQLRRGKEPGFKHKGRKREESYIWQFNEALVSKSAMRLHFKVSFKAYYYEVRLRRIRLNG